MSKNIATTSITSVFPQTRISLAIRNMAELKGLELRFLEQELKHEKIIISVEAETPDGENNAVGIKGTFVVSNDTDYILDAQWGATANVLIELNEILNAKRLNWEKSQPLEPRSFTNESVEIINKDLKLITKAEISELGISTGKYRFKFEVKTVRCGSTLTSLEVEGFAHMR